MVRLLPFRIAQAHRSSSLHCGPNDNAIVALLLVLPDGSDSKLGSRLAYARAGVAGRFCGRTCHRRAVGRRPVHGRIEATWNRFGIAANKVWFDEAATNRATEMVPKRSAKIGGSNRRWRESRCLGPWCRSPMGERSASSKSGQIPSTIPKSISDGVSRCSLPLALGASGSRMGAAAPRTHRNTGCSLITSRNSATVAPRSIQETVSACAVPTTPAKPCKPGRASDVPDEGVGGLNPWEEAARYRTYPHAQIFFSSQKF
jgi:hypothetical protein